MKTLHSYLWCLFAPLFLISCSADDDNSVPGNPVESDPVLINFESDISILENSAAQTIEIIFDAPAIANGEINVKFTADEGLSYVVEPALVNDMLKLNVLKDQESASFKVKISDDDVIKGHKNLDLTLNSVSSGFTIGDIKTISVEVEDDELVGKPKSFSGGGIKHEYYYQEDGKVNKVIKLYAGPTSTTTHYSYDGDGNILSIITDDFYGEQKVNFYWKDGKLEKSEEYTDNELVSYSLYDYDTAGNIGGKAVYQPDQAGEFKENFIYVYLYFTTGNLYKQQIYYHSENDVDYSLISTRTYDNYLDKTNLFPVNEIIPGIMTQKNLPGLYRIEENGSDLTFIFTYEYSEKGFAIKRNTQGEEIIYEYY